MTQEIPLKKANHPRLVIFLMLVVLLGPFFFALTLIKKGDIHQFKLNNHGDLITPAKDITSLKAFEKQDIHGKWWLVYLGAEQCKSQCEEIAYNMRQIKTALGKDANRIERLYISNPNCRASVCDKYLQKNYSDIHKIKISNLEHSLFFNDLSNGLYIIDPNGYLMMHYEVNTPAKDILTDLKRLLKVSKNG